MDAPQVGDWIRFRRGGVLVIGQVEYITPRFHWDSTPNFHTDLGETTQDGILEIRAKFQRPEPARDEQEPKS